ncbi:MAG: hypothetical protein KAT43_05985 [Nanoarchaeota archaeon]|nr:hypothetical protein [Nanoarchaeota archaeon]
MIKQFRTLFIISILIFSIFSVLVSAQDDATHILINSDDWRDVYSGLLYGHLEAKTTKFLISDVHSNIVLKTVPRGSKVFVLESADSPYIVNIADSFGTLGFSTESVMKSSDPFETNLELAKITGVTNFVIVDPSYGYNALAVGPYAVLTNAFVLFANEDNIPEVVDLLESSDVEKLLLYGTLDRAVTKGLAQFNPEVINTGNRFDDNIEIVKKHKAIKSNKQIMLSNGEFIEDALLSGGPNNEAVLYVGRDNVPQQVVDYIKGSDIAVGVLVGNALLNNANSLKDRTGISVFVKFAQGTTQEGAFQRVMDLETFPMPSYDLGISIENLKYNTKTKQLEVIYNNEKDLIVYFKSTFNILLDDENKGTVGDETPVFLDKGETLGVAYDIDLTADLAGATEKKLMADVYTTFGESTRSLEHVMSGLVPIEFIEVEDNSKMKALGVKYHEKIQRFMIKVENIGDVDAYANPNLVGLIINDIKTDIGSAKSTFIKKGEIKEINIKQRMDEVDIVDNEQVKVITYFGERENVLLNKDEGTFDLKVISETNMTMIIVIVVIILVILLIAFFFFKRRSAPVAAKPGKKKTTVKKKSAQKKKKKKKK